MKPGNCLTFRFAKTEPGRHDFIYVSYFDKLRMMRELLLSRRSTALKLSSDQK